MTPTEIRNMIRRTESRVVREQGWAWLQRHAANKRLGVATLPFPDDYGRHVHSGWGQSPTWAGYEKCSGCELIRPVKTQAAA